MATKREAPEYVTFEANPKVLGELRELEKRMAALVERQGKAVATSVCLHVAATLAQAGLQDGGLGMNLETFVFNARKVYATVKARRV